MPYILAVRQDNHFKSGADSSWAPWSLRSFEQVMLQLSERGGFSTLNDPGPMKNSPIKPLYLESSLEFQLSLKLCVRSRGADHNTALFKSFKLTDIKHAGFFHLSIKVVNFSSLIHKVKEKIVLSGKKMCSLSTAINFQSK